MTGITLTQPKIQAQTDRFTHLDPDDIVRAGYENLETNENFFTLSEDNAAYRVNARWGDDQIRIQGTSEFAHDIVYAGSGNDRVFTGGGNDTVYGGSGDDMIFGEAGHDRLLGGTGKDTLHGGIGNDTMLGGSDDDVFFGGLGHDVIEGGDGADVLYGGDFVNFALNPDDAGGHDTLSGGAGNDTLVGGVGGDRMTGGAGADVFVFTDVIEFGDEFVIGPDGLTTRYYEEITDFDRTAGDRIDLSAIDAKLTAGNPLNDTFTFTSGPSTAAGSLWINPISPSGEQLVSFTVGVGIKTLRVQVTDGSPLQASDFHL